MSRKFQNRINELVKHAIMTLIERDLNDPRCDGVSVTDVEVTSDTAHATIYFSIIGDAEKRKQAGEGLRSASGWLSRELGQRLRTKNTPRLTFKFDESLERGEHIQQLIDSIKQQDKPLAD